MEGEPEGGPSIVAGTYTVTNGQKAYKIVLVSDHQVEVDGARHDVDLVSLNDRSFSFILDGKTFSVERTDAQRIGGLDSDGDGDLSHTVRLSVKGSQYVIRVDDEHSLLVRSLSTKPLSSDEIQVIRAPMPGLISRIEVKVGDEVIAGKGLLVLEAMKMENEIRSLRHGRIQNIHVEKGKPVEKNEPLVTIAKL